MANIAPLPSGAALIADPSTPSRGRYGPHAHFNRAGHVIELKTNRDRVVQARLNGTMSVMLEDIEPKVVPYVNKFIHDTGMKVETYWRTGKLRLTAIPGVMVSRSAVGVKAPTLREQVEVEPVVEVDDPEPVVEPEQRAAPVITLAASSNTLAPIPGVEHPAKVTVKPAAEGMVDIGGIVVPDADLVTLQDAWALRQAGRPAATLITGPAGTAKTALARAFAASIGVPFLKVDGGAIRTADDWAGAFRQDANTKTWAHRWSPFAQVLRAGVPMVVLIDELNRTESPQALNALLGLLDWTGSLLVPDANATLHLPKGVLVVATANIGPEFVGTLPLDGAVRQRFPYGVRLDYPRESVETDLLVNMTGITRKLAARLVVLAAQQRVNRDDAQQYPSGAVISTRVIIDIANRIKLCDTDPRQAVASTLAGQFEPGDQQALDLLVDTQFPPPEVKDVPEALITLGKHHFLAPTWGVADGTCERPAPIGAGLRCGQSRTNPVHI